MTDGPRVPRILAVANQKGGVGKTTTAINLATALAAAGKPTLIVDLDPQGNATTGVGVERRRDRLSAFDLLCNDATIAQTVLPTAVPGMRIVPSSLDLAGAEMAMIDMPRREFRLREALRGAAAGSGASGQLIDLKADFVLIDCPPSLNLITLNALVAADGVVIPLQCEFFALEGLTLMMQTIEQVRHSLNPALSIHGVVLTMYDRRNALSGMVAADVRGHFGDTVYETVIPRNVRVSEAPSYGQPVLLYDLNCAGSQAYVHLAGEVLRREAGSRKGAAA